MDDLPALHEIGNLEEIHHKDVPEKSPDIMESNLTEARHAFFAKEECFHTVVLDTKNPRRSKFKTAIAEEVNGLMEKQTFKEVRQSQLSETQLRGLNILRANFLLAIKDPGTSQERNKARFVVQA